MHHTSLVRAQQAISTRIKPLIVPCLQQEQKLSFSSLPRGLSNDEKPTNISLFQRGVFEVRRFSRGVKLLLDDYQTYRNIDDAIASPRNAWISGPPRRQLEQRRQFLFDLQIALPTVSLFAIPIVGYLAPILAAVFPRQMLSKQFQTKQEHQKYAELEHNLRKRYYIQLTNFLFRRYDQCDEAATIAGLRSNLANMYDEAGPVVDMEFFIKFLIHPMLTTTTNWDMSTLSTCASLEVLSRQHVQMLFMICGFTKLPPYAANAVYNRYLLPSGIFRHILRNVGQSIIRDDACLLRESGDLHQCTSHDDCISLNRMTDEEVFEACVLRGLPVNLPSTSQMKKCLFNHLLMMRNVELFLLQQERNAGACHSESEIKWPSNYSEPVHDFLVLITLHLAAVRYGLQTRNSHS